MTTNSWSTRVRHDSDATYQEWRDEFITKLGVVGLAADETNITAGAGARPGASTEQGYAVYHLNDSLHGTAPIYIRFGFGTAASTTAPRIQVTVGTSTNGSGVLGGTALTTIRTAQGNAAQTADTNRQSLMCATSGFFGTDWKIGASATETFFAVCRTVDSSGAITAIGALVVWGLGTTNNFTATQALRFASTAVAYTAQTTLANMSLCLNPQSPTVTTVGSDIQAMLAWTITPAVAPLIALCGILDNEISTTTTFTAVLVGSTSRTYIACSTVAGPMGPLNAGASGGLKPAMLWE